MHPVECFAHEARAWSPSSAWSSGRSWCGCWGSSPTSVVAVASSSASSWGGVWSASEQMAQVGDACELGDPIERVGHLVVIDSLAQVWRLHLSLGAIGRLFSEPVKQEELDVEHKGGRSHLRSQLSIHLVGESCFNVVVIGQELEVIRRDVVFDAEECTEEDSL